MVEKAEKYLIFKCELGALHMVDKSLLDEAIIQEKSIATMLSIFVLNNRRRSERETNGKFTETSILHDEFVHVTRTVYKDDQLILAGSQDDVEVELVLAHDLGLSAVMVQQAFHGIVVVVAGLCHVHASHQSSQM